MARRRITRHDKLVRDRIPKIIRSNREVATFRILSKGYLRNHHLFLKLLEESKEAYNAKDSKNAILELIDVQEVIDEILHQHSVSIRYFRTLQAHKRRSRGGFRLGIFLESTHKA